MRPVIMSAVLGAAMLQGQTVKQGRVTDVSGRQVTVTSSDEEETSVLLACVQDVSPEAADWMEKYVKGKVVQLAYMNSALALLTIGVTNSDVSLELVKRGLARPSVNNCRKKDSFRYIRAEYEYKLGKANTTIEKMAIANAMSELDELERQFNKRK